MCDMCTCSIGVFEPNYGHTCTVKIYSCHWIKYCTCAGNKTLQHERRVERLFLGLTDGESVTMNERPNPSLHRIPTGLTC